MYIVHVELAVNSRLEISVKIASQIQSQSVIIFSPDPLMQSKLSVLCTHCAADTCPTLRKILDSPLRPLRQ